jgi:poly(hydroxyalkanoate) granule-associated protein
MFETMNKIMLAGLGALSMTRERAEKIFDEYVQRGEAARGDREGFVRDLIDSADRAREDLAKVVRTQLHQVVEEMNLATREDIARLQARLDELLPKC